MGTSGPSSRHTLEDIRSVFAQRDVAGAPLTTSEIADAIDATQSTARDKLGELADRGALGTREIGSGDRVWWPTERLEATRADADNALEHAQFRELAEAVTDYAIFVLDEDGNVRTWNEGAKQLKGYAEDEIVGEHFSTFYTESDREAGVPDRNLQGAIDDGRIEDEGWRVRNDGSRFWANVTITALRDDDGDLRGFVKITRDMTERHEYEQRLREQRDRFETLVREVKDYAIFLLDADGTVQTWNEGAKQLKGYTEDEIVGEHFSAFYPEDDREANRPTRNLRVAAEEGRVEDEGERVRKDGSRFWANVTITALYDDEGDVRGFAKVTRDMTERHEYEQRLRDQRDELDELNQINAVIRDIDQALVTATSREEIEQAVCNRLAESDTYSAAWTAEYADDYEEIQPRTWAGIDGTYLNRIRAADADTAEGLEKGVGATALRTREVQSVDQLQTDPGGEPWREASLDEGYESAITVPLVYNDVEYGILTVYADSKSAFDDRKVAVMSELGETTSHAIAAIRRKERERTLTALQESTRRLLNASDRREIGDIIVRTLTDTTDLTDATMYCLDAAEDALEPVSASLRGTDVERLPAVTAESDSPVWTSFAERETRVTESVVAADGGDGRRTMVVPLGEYGALAVTSAERETFDGHIQHLVELVAATGEAALKRTDRERRLQRQNDRLDSFASMLAHELRNPITIGQIYGQQLSAGSDDDEAVEYVTEAFDRIEDMVDVLLVLARGREAVDEGTDIELADVVREAWDETDAPDASLAVEIDSTIQADETYVRHLFRNLLENAVEHGGSEVTITVGELPTGFYVADDGVGIPPDERDAVFETGYTTAAGEGGTGLGLAFVEELADVYGWSVAVTDSDAGGARFEFTNVER